MAERDEALFDLFLEASAALTGYDVFTLQGTGIAGDYFDHVVASAGEKPLRGLCGKVCDPATGRARTHQEITAAIDAGGTMDPLAQQVIGLWYLGTWNPTPNDPNGAALLSGRSYVEGLVWQAIGSHPQAAKQQGFGAWAQEPRPGIG
ncbi:MAG: hypothetical protein M3169_02415 [Candidatus Eremiobacteraeota bacterium]|nr:hypothetical protein [Candidatus Eremiobacteraeota bacterium]